MGILNQFGNFLGSIIRTSIWFAIFIIVFAIYFVVSNFYELVIFGATCMSFYLIYKAANLYFDYMRKKYNL
jgi:hypothetical protein